MSEPLDLPACCPRCLARRREDGFNRFGWYSYDCGRGYSPSLNNWRPMHEAEAGCLARRLEQAFDLLHEGRILSHSNMARTAQRTRWRREARELEERSNG